MGAPCRLAAVWCKFTRDLCPQVSLIPGPGADPAAHFYSSWELSLIRILLAWGLAFLKHVEFIPEHSLLTVG